LTPDLLRGLDGALVTDLFPYFKFTEPFVIGEWRFRRQKKRRSYEFSVPRGGEVLVLGMEVWHSGRRISGTQYCDNWSFIATPVFRQESPAYLRICPRRNDGYFSGDG
jgi:hypothetical protein